MKANLFALFCITLFVLSVPQAFAEDTNSTVTTPQTVEENPTETLVTEVPPTSVEEQPDVVSEPTETVTKAPEPAPVENSADEEVAEKSVAAADTETNKAEDDAEKVQTVEPVDAPVDPEADSEGEQDSTEQVAAPSGEENTTEENAAAPSGEENTTEENAAAPSGEEKTTEENTATAAETPETDETNETAGATEANETEETPETPAAVPTEAPGSNNATNTEPSAPVSSPEENQEAAPAAEESQETAPAAEQLEKKDGLSFFGLISKILVGLGLLSVVILVGCVYHYRYQMQKYKIAPFTPPSFLPECLFPRNTESSGRLISGYTELQVGNYQSAPRFAEI